MNFVGNSEKSWEEERCDGEGSNGSRLLNSEKSWEEEQEYINFTREKFTVFINFDQFQWIISNNIVVIQKIFIKLNVSNIKLRQNLLTLWISFFTYIMKSDKWIWHGFYI